MKLWEKKAIGDGWQHRLDNTWYYPKKIYARYLVDKYHDEIYQLPKKYYVEKIVARYVQRDEELDDGIVTTAKGVHPNLANERSETIGNFCYGYRKKSFSETLPLFPEVIHFASAEFEEDEDTGEYLWSGMANYNICGKVEELKRIGYIDSVVF